MNKQLEKLEEETNEALIRINSIRSHIVEALDETIDLRNDLMKRLQDTINKLKS